MNFEIFRHHDQLLRGQVHFFNEWFIFAKFWEFFFIDLFSHFIREIDIVTSVWAEDLRGLEGTFVDAFLTVLEIEAHIVVLKYGIKHFLDSADVLYLS